MVDRISRLPDEVLCHILSFLRTQEAVATSVLSKRWRHLWSSVPALDFDSGELSSPCFFERLVHATLLIRDPQQSITRFRLIYRASDSGGVNFDRSNGDVNAWVITAIRRRVENLHIRMCPRNFMIRLSGCIFSCRTLVVLKLKGLFLNVHSSSVELPSLKSLHLEIVKFAEPQCLMELLYGCPALENLKTILLDYARHGAVCKEGFKLPKLVRAYLSFVGITSTNILLKAICNVEFLTIRQSGVVNVIPEFPRLRHLSLLYLVASNRHLVLLILKNCPKVQSFNLRGSFQAQDVLPPGFVVPECLTSHLKEFYFEYYKGIESNLQFAKYIMQNSTFLQTMEIHRVSASPLEKLEILKELSFCPRKSASCLLSIN